MQQPVQESSGSGPPLSGPGRIFGSGEMAERTRAFDWSRTPLGAIAEWPDALVVLVNMMLANQQPMLLFWGDELTQFYNDAAISTLGSDKHPGALGERAVDCWAEVWPVVGQQIEDARRGNPIWNEDMLAPIFRRGRVRDAWFTYSYSPVRDAGGTICGVLVTELETTRRVLAERALRGERERLLSLFQQAPAFFAVLSGPDHVFEMANPQYSRLINHRDVLGRRVAEALPEAVDQGWVEILDKVYNTGEPFVGQDVAFTLAASDDHPTEVRNLDFMYQPLRGADGMVNGVMVLGVDITERKRAAEALLETQRSAASVLDAISDGFHSVDAEGRFRQFNEAGREIYKAQGIDCDSLIGRLLTEALPEIEHSETGRALLTSLRERRPTSVDGCYRPWNRWFSVRNFPTPDGGVATFFQDITERKEAENQLAQQRERLELATAAAQLGYWFCNLPFGKLNWDATVKDHFFVAPDAEVDIELFYERIHPEVRARVRESIEHAIATHGRYDVDFRTVSADGREKSIRAIGRTAYAEDGRPLTFDGITQDITALRDTRQALDAESRRLSAVFENVPIGLLFTLTDGRIVRGNRQAEKILGKSFSAGTQEAYSDLLVFHADGTRVDVSERPLRRALGDSGIHRGEFIYQRPDGKRIWVEMTAAPILDAEGRAIGAVDAFADIDVRKRTELALVRSEKLALVGRLAATISHEINNPLEAVTNLLYLIDRNATDDTTKSFARMAQDELARVAHIVTHTLRFNRQSVGIAEERMSGLMESSVAIYEGRLKNSGISLNREYADTERVLCSGSELRQVFANLIGNAFDATKNGGKLILRTRNQRNWQTGDAGVRVTIADTGMGMPEQVRQRLFEPFFTTKGDNGTGLGLWVSREILDKHHARLKVRSRQGEPSGTVFSIWFPLDAAAYMALQNIAGEHSSTAHP